ncbi:MAG: hypothetical protein M3441_26110, partial [Chloroflexota bacterium]|nr:hypothetical protein [Chloroflexota bacterium]
RRVESDRDIERSCAHVTMIGTERPDTKVEVILGVDTHTHTHTWTSTRWWPWTIFWAGAWAS